MPKGTHIDLAAITHVHFIGIGGIGISALARLMLHEGKRISGTNDSESPRTLDALRNKGVAISIDTDPNALPEADCYVYSDAWLDNFPAVVERARGTGKPTLSYAGALGIMANRYYLIAICGAHGKTTTTAMVIDVLEEAGLDPTGIVGSLRAQTQSNFRAGESKYCVVEADEYRRHFLTLKPDVLVITNIDADHLDYYRDLADIQDAFAELARRVPEEGFIVCDPNDPAVKPVVENVVATILDYSKLIDPLLALYAPGIHNVLNAGAAFGVAHALGIKKEVARKALEEFTGTWRRSEYIGETTGGALVFDDYAHHPAEIETTLKGFRERYPLRRMVVAFQPHLYSRTKVFFDGFVAALTLADEVVFAPIFEARKEADHSVSSEGLANAIAEIKGIRTSAFGSYETIARYLAQSAGGNDLIITMGAGAINTVAEMITGKT